MTPQIRRFDDGSIQFKEIFEGLLRGGIRMQTLWVQVVSPEYWDSPDTYMNTVFISQIFAEAQNYGVEVGFYTQEMDWQDITNGFHIDNTTLWYASTHDDGSETAPNFDNFMPFANFKKPTVKQFSKYYRTCGLLMNRNVYQVTWDFEHPYHGVPTEASAELTTTTPAATPTTSYPLKF